MSTPDREAPTGVPTGTRVCPRPLGVMPGETRKPLEVAAAAAQQWLDALGRAPTGEELIAFAENYRPAPVVVPAVVPPTAERRLRVGAAKVFYEAMPEHWSLSERLRWHDHIGAPYGTNEDIKRLWRAAGLIA